MGSILNAETDINPQAPANQAKKGDVTALTSDNKLGYGVPDEQQRMADMISQLSGFDPTQQVPTGADDVLPPSYYNPTQNQSVILGSSGGLGGNSPLMSAGIPMFSPSVLQQADEQLKEAKKLKYESDMQDAENLGITTTPKLTNHTLINDGLLRWQSNIWNKEISGAIERDGTNAYRKNKRRFMQRSAEINNTVATVNELKDMATKIQILKAGGTLTDAGGKGKSEFWVADLSVKKADEYLALIMSDEMIDMPPEELNKTLSGYKKYFVKANSLKESTAALATAMNTSITTGDFVFKKSYGKDAVYGVDKKTGLAAMEGELLATYQQRIEDNWADEYGHLDKKLQPTLKEYTNTLMSQVSSKVEETYQKLSSHKKDKPDSRGKDNRTPVLITDKDVVQVANGQYQTQNNSSFKDVVFSGTLLSRGLYSKDTGNKYDTEGTDTKINTIIMYDGIPFVFGVNKVEGIYSEPVFGPLTSQYNERIGQEVNFQVELADGTIQDVSYPVVDTPEKLAKAEDIIKNKKDALRDKYRQQVGDGKESTYTQREEQSIKNTMDANPSLTREQVINALGI